MLMLEVCQWMFPYLNHQHRQQSNWTHRIPERTMENQRTFWSFSLWSRRVFAKYFSCWERNISPPSARYRRSPARSIWRHSCRGCQVRLSEILRTMSLEWGRLDWPDWDRAGSGLRSARHTWRSSPRLPPGGNPRRARSLPAALETNQTGRLLLQLFLNWMNLCQRQQYELIRNSLKRVNPLPSFIRFLVVK